MTTIGDNKPPIDRELLAHRFADLVKRHDALLEAEDRMPDANDEASAQKVADFANQVSAMAKAFDQKRKEEKQPYLEAGRQVDAFFNGMIVSMNQLKMRVLKNLNRYLQRKAADNVQEESIAKASQVRGEYGSVASLHSHWTFGAINRTELDLEALRMHLPIDGVEQAIRAFIRTGGRELRGVEIFQESKPVVK